MGRGIHALERAIALDSDRFTSDPVAVNAVLSAVRQAADVLCDRWSLALLLFAHSGITRFGDFRSRSGMATRQLAARLSALESQEILIRMPYSRRPLRHGYHLTTMGRASFDLLACMVGWQQAFGETSDATRVEIAHGDCKAALPVAHCRHCARVVHARNVGELRVHRRDVEALPRKSMTYRRTSASTSRASSHTPLPLPDCLEIFGDKWSIEILVTTFMRVKSFLEFQHHTGISSNVLADRLARLRAFGVFEQAGEPGRAGRYRLTEKGIALYPILLAIEAWADAWLPDRLHSPFRLHHLPCSEPVQLALRCDACGQALEAAHAEIRISS